MTDAPDETDTTFLPYRRYFRTNTLIFGMAAQLLWINFELAGEVSDEEMTEFAEGIAG